MEIKWDRDPWQVGRPYPRGDILDEGTEYLYENGRHELRLCWKGAGESTIAAPAELALFTFGLVLWLVFRFRNDDQWAAVPYSIQGSLLTQKILPNPNPEEQTLLRVIAVDGMPRIITGLRHMRLSQDFAKAFHSAILFQARATRPMAEVYADLRRAEELYPEPLDMRKAAKASMIEVDSPIR